MKDLPSNWTNGALSEICERIVDGSHNPPKPSQLGHPMLSARNINDYQIVFDDYRLISESDFDIEHSRTNVLPGDVLLTIVGTIGRMAVVPVGLPSFALQRSVAVLKPFKIDSRYLAYALATPEIQRWFLENAKGTAQKGVYLTQLGTLRIPVAPRAEQTRIVAKLEELLSDLDAGVEELKAAQKKLAQYRQSLLKAAVEGALTAEWRANLPSPSGGGVGGEGETGEQLLQRILKERRAHWEAKQLAKFKEQGKTPPKDWQAKYPEPVQPDVSNLPDLPEGWVWATMDQMAIEQKYGSSAKTNEDKTGVPVLRMGNIQDGELDWRELKYLPITHDEFPSLYLKDGDLLFNRTNSPELVGKTAVYRSHISPCSYASYLISVRLSDYYFPELASAYINSIHGRLWVKSVVTQQVGQANVNGTKLAALAIPIPPFEEQKEIARLLDEQRSASSEQMKNVQFSLNQSAAQRKNILKAAFSGQLVPQDPNDEPASVLLERIRAERSEQAKTHKSRSPKESA